jgi:hypothetical protein
MSILREMFRSAQRARAREAYGHHGFAGQDTKVVRIVTGWLKALR